MFNNTQQIGAQADTYDIYMQVSTVYYGRNL